MSDLISRQAAIDAIEKMQMPIMRSEYAYDQFKFCGLGMAREILIDLPPVTPAQKMGRWSKVELMSGRLPQCSECGYTAAYTSNFCPECGAKMEVEK